MTSVLDVDQLADDQRARDLENQGANTTILMPGGISPEKAHVKSGDKQSRPGRVPGGSIASTHPVTRAWAVMTRT